MILHIYGLVYTIVYVILCRMFLENFSKKREKLQNTYTVPVLLLVLAVSEYLLSVMLADYMFIKAFVIILLDTWIMWICFKQKFIRTMILVCFYQGLCFATDYISLAACDRFFAGIQEEQSSDPVMNFFMGVLSQILLFCILLVVNRIFARNDARVLTELEWVRYAVFPVFTIVSVMGILANFDATTNTGQKNVLLCIASGLLIMNVLVYDLIHSILRREIQIRKNRLFQERVKNELAMYQQISENFDRQRKREHEYKNQMTVISALAEKKELAKLNQYLSGYKEIACMIDTIDTNHVVVNAILNTKYQEAKEKGIVFVLKVNDLSGIRIMDEDVVIILSNLLNNALEACENCENKIIKVKFVKEKEQIIISVVNTFLEKPVILEGEYRTSKEDVFMHGIGISNVKDTVAKYNGSCVIRHENHLFQFYIFIPEE